MLELLSGPENFNEENILKTCKAKVLKKTTDKGKSKSVDTTKKCNSDTEELHPNEEQIISCTENDKDYDDDEGDRNEDCPDGLEEKDQGAIVSNEVVHYIEYRDDSNQIMEYNSLDGILETDEEIFHLDNENQIEKNNRDGYLEEYEQLLEDDTTNAGVLYEDNEDFKMVSVQELTNSSVFVKTIVVKMPSSNKNLTKNEIINAPLENFQKSQNISEKQTIDTTRKYPQEGEWMRKFSSSVTGSTRFYCSKCNRDFSTRTNLTRHLLLHEGKRPYQCNICLKDFSQNGTLKQHMYTHTGEKPHVCSVCNRGFTQAKSLVFHMRRHTGDKPHNCDYCGNLFRQKDALKAHIFKHHTNVGERTFSCKICNENMNGQELHSHMKKHLNNHKKISIVTKDDVVQTADESNFLSESIYLTDDPSIDADESTHVIDIMAASTTEPSRAKKYQCRTCFKCFAIKKNLIRHLSFHNIPASSLHQCQRCELVFDTKYALKMHCVRDHKEVEINLNECDDCQIQFENAKELNDHMQSKAHTFVCSICPDMKFASKKLLNDHYLEHNINEVEGNE